MKVQMHTHESVFLIKIKFKQPQVYVAEDLKSIRLCVYVREEEGGEGG